MNKLNGWIIGAAFVLCPAIASSAQSYSIVASFNSTNGVSAEAALMQGPDGNLYGTAIWGGIEANYCDVGCGTIFKVTLAGKIILLYTFCSQPNCSDGAEPYGGLVLGTDGNFYGTTIAGGTGTGTGNCNGVIPACGTVYKITPEGKLTTLYNFCSQPDCADGAQPLSALVQAANLKLYGMTSAGGAYGSGTIFEITTEGNFTNLQSFDLLDGESPASRDALLEGVDGDFYGTTVVEGAYGDDEKGGTVFKVEPNGVLTAIYNFCAQPRCADGSESISSLVQGKNGSFYGTTYSGGAHGWGTVFEVTPEGKLTTLYSFCRLPNCTDGTLLYGRVIQATDGHLYGTTYSGGHSDQAGTIYELTPEGLTTLYYFCSQPNCDDGGFPWAGLLQATNGKLYGITSGGGTGGTGVVFSLDMGLGPFVSFVHGAGKVNQIAGILGQGFTGTTSVLLNGIPANFTVVSDTFIKATVPPGATTGYVTVTTPTGVLSSNVPFHVIP
jgi:uncharacterized repeat protein (TIGR03803 family)